MTGAGQPVVFGVTGWSGSGKTTLVVRLIPRLKAAGLTVSTIKHAHKGFDIDRPGKDSYKHREAGAEEVMLAAPSRWVLLHETGDDAEPGLDELLARMAPVDLVLVEGFKRDRHPKLEVWRGINDRPPVAADDASVVAVASDGPVPGVSVPVVPLDDIDGIVRLILDHVRRGTGRPAAESGPKNVG